MVNGYLDRRGVTLIELMVVIAIVVILAGLGIVGLTGGGLTTETKARSNAENLRQYLNYARIAAIGKERVIVVFNPSQQFYYACIDNSPSAGDGECSAAEAQNIQLSKPDIANNASGVAVRGVKLKHDAAFGTIASGPQKTLSGTLERTSDGAYYMTASSTDIASDGMHTTAASPSRFVFRRNGNAESGSVYLYLLKDDTSYHYAINVNSRGKVDLYQWLMVGGSYRWKLISTR